MSESVLALELCMNLSITNENVNLCCHTSTGTCMSTKCKDLPTHTSIPYSSKSSWSKHFVNTLKMTWILIFIIKISWLRFVNPHPLWTVDCFKFCQNNFRDWSLITKFNENIVPQKFGAIRYGKYAAIAFIKLHKIWSSHRIPATSIFRYMYMYYCKSFHGLWLQLVQHWSWWLSLCFYCLVTARYTMCEMLHAWSITSERKSGKKSSWTTGLVQKLFNTNIT